MQVLPNFRIGTLAAATVAATLLATGCTSVLTAADVIEAVSRQAKQATSATAVLDMQVTGKDSLSVHGIVKVRTKPDLAIEIDMTQASADGQSIPGGMEEILTGKGLYLRIQQLAQETGKPWAGITAAQFNQLTGTSLSNLTQEAGREDPLSAAQLLGATKDVKAVGTGTVAGVHTTHYRGTFSFTPALTRLNPRMRQMMGQVTSEPGLGPITFDAWVDSDNHIRQLTESFDLPTAGRFTMKLLFTSVNQPVSISVPPPSEVASLPGL